MSLSKYTSPKVLLPIAAAVAGIGIVSYLSCAKKISNENAKAFNGDGTWVDLKLIKSTEITHDTKHLVFELPSKDQVSGLTTASLLLTKFVTAKGNNVIRPYTPVSDVDQKGTVEFVIKKYETGKMSSHIHSLAPNDTLSFKGPVVKWKWEPNQFESISLIGGGSGITPLYQLVNEITKNPADKTKVSLFYGSQTEEDVILKPELDKIARDHKDQVTIHYFVDKASDSWNGITGYITKDFLQKHLPSPSAKSKIFVCGPPGMYQAISGHKISPSDQGEVSGALAELGYTKENVFKF
jgi:cytochrome-b5 reductase